MKSILHALSIGILLAMVAPACGPETGDGSVSSGDTTASAAAQTFGTDTQNTAGGTKCSISCPAPRYDNTSCTQECEAGQRAKCECDGVAEMRHQYAYCRCE
jgi:hypothetical protein